MESIGPFCTCITLLDKLPVSLVILFQDKNEHLFGFAIDIACHEFWILATGLFVWDNYLHHLKLKCWNGELHTGDNTTLWRISKIPFSSFYNIRIFLLPSGIAVSGKLAFTGSTILRRRHIARSGPKKKTSYFRNNYKCTNQNNSYFLWIEQNTQETFVNKIIWEEYSNTDQTIILGL